MAADIRRTPREADLGLRTISNKAGLAISVLPNGCLFAIEERREGGPLMINQILGTALGGGIARLYLRTGPKPDIEAVGPAADVECGAGADRFVWRGEVEGIAYSTTLWLHPEEPLWLWQVAVTNNTGAPQRCDAILAQDIGLGPRGFLMNGEAYASQYIDHHIAAHPRSGPVIMSRQNLRQAGGNPWVAHGCLGGAAGYATDARQLFGAAFRESGALAIGLRDLPSERLQHEVACAVLQSRRTEVGAGETSTWTFFGIYLSDHAGPSGDADLARVDAAERAARDFVRREVGLAQTLRSVVQAAPAALSRPLDEAAIARLWPERSNEEWRDGERLSFFVPTPDDRRPPRSDGGPRHVVLREKELIVARRHGALLRSGEGMLLDEATLCATAWMHGVFGAQLTIGNTSLQKLFSVSRDPYNITRSSGLRILIDCGAGWRLLTVPSAFDIGLSDCAWIYRLDDRTVTVRAMAAGSDPAMQWRIAVDGPPCRFLILGHLVLGERELDHRGRIEIDAARKRIVFSPDPDWLWGQRRPQAAYHLVVDTPDAVAAIGGEELLYGSAPVPSSTGCMAIVTTATTRFSFAVTGSMTDPAVAESLAEKYATGVADPLLTAPAADYWRRVTRGFRIAGERPEVAALDALFPWLAQNAMVHLTVPHGLEQYTGAAWGTRDVCQGPVEFLLALEHDAVVREILKLVFAEQGEATADWPQWFMLPPYSNIRDSHSHGDVIVWPLKAVCDYVEATNDLGFLDEPVAWRRPDGTASDGADTIAAHVDKLIAACRQRSIAGTELMRYGEGDWNDSLQPVDPHLKDWMVSSWTVILFFQQIVRYAEVLRRAGQAKRSAELSELAAVIRNDINRHLIRDGTIAGYAVFTPEGGPPELLLHPTDKRTGLRYSLLPMVQGVLAELFTPEQTRHHLRLIRENLLFPDGVRLMDRPVAYRGGIETVFRRAESSSFFGREIGLMYVHFHLRYCEAMAMLGEADAFFEGLQVVNPVAVTDCVARAEPRQRNAYFSSSDAAFADRYAAAGQWSDVKAGRVRFEGGWRIYSSGPGLYINLILRYVLGRRRTFGERTVAPMLPAGLAIKPSIDLPAG
jgi:cellobiose phosphorylase